MSAYLSSEALPEAVRYTQRKPHEWDGLVACAADNIDPHMPHDQQIGAVEALAEYATFLDVERFDTNRYYGLGIVACSAMRTLATDEGRSELIKTTIRSMVDGHATYCAQAANHAHDPNQGLYTEEIHRKQLGDNGIKALGPQYLTMAERVTANFLDGVPIEYLRSERLSPQQIQDILHKDPALQNMGDNAYSGAALIMQVTLKRLYERASGTKWPEDPTYNPPIRDIVSDEEIQSLQLRKPSMVCAKVRVDELRETAFLVKLDAAGQPEIDPARIPTVPADPEAKGELTGLYHRARLRCPALYVAGMIPLVAEAMPQIVLGAQERLLAHAA